MKEIIMILILLMVLGCTTAPDTVETVSQTITGDVVTEVAGNDANIKTFEIRLLKQGFVPDTIEVDKGDTVRLYVVTLSEHRGFVIEGLNIEERLPKEESVVIEFKADKNGVFEYGCGIYCQPDKEAMIGSLIVN
jgi:plastocyanin